MSNDELLRHVAALMREHSNNPSGPPVWWTPDIAVAVAEWLEIEADVYGADVAPQAVALAQAYLAQLDHDATVAGISHYARDKYRGVLARLGEGSGANDE